jgi:hypothetical protein
MTGAFGRPLQSEDDEYPGRPSERRRRGIRRGFHIHLTSDLAVQALLVATWAASGAGYLWFAYPLLGWGIGLASHYAAVRESLRDGALVPRLARRFGARNP